MKKESSSVGIESLRAASASLAGMAVKLMEAINVTSVDEFAAKVIAFQKESIRAEERAKRILDTVANGSLQDVFEEVAREPIDALTLMELLEDTNLGGKALIQYEEMRSNLARKGALARLDKDKDGKQAAKQGVYEWWLNWKATPGLYKSKAEFARSMLDKYPALQSLPHVSRWCLEWERGENLPTR